tara:strand:+ start:1482 stop:2642 length:1161 start_codon:yes stop_codon:yes gene_type:complete
MGLSRLLNKINKAKSAINSLKGISSKLNSLKYTTQIDKLGEEAEAARSMLADKRKSVDSMMAANKAAQERGFSNPVGPDEELIYPLDEELQNYIVFSIRPRRKRNAKSAANLMSDGVTEIMLYVPDGLGSEATVTYAKQEIGAGARAMTNIQDAEGFMDTLEEVGEQAVAAGSRMLTGALNGMTGGAKNLREGRATNPMIEQTFEGVDFRSFTFDYEFYPRSKDEAAMVQKIIYNFKTAMLPDTYGAGITEGEDSDDAAADVENYFNYPNIFDVTFEGPLQKRLDGFLPMVCTGVDVDYFNGNSVAYFEDGTPITTSMRLSFSEIKILSQESYQEISPYGDKSISSMPSMLDETTENAADIDSSTAGQTASTRDYTTNSAGGGTNP